jgi:hypothetical protein
MVEVLIASGVMAFFIILFNGSLSLAQASTRRAAHRITLNEVCHSALSELQSLAAVDINKLIRDEFESMPHRLPQSAQRPFNDPSHRFEYWLQTQGPNGESVQAPRAHNQWLKTWANLYNLSSINFSFRLALPNLATAQTWDELYPSDLPPSPGSISKYNRLISVYVQAKDSTGAYSSTQCSRRIGHGKACLGDLSGDGMITTQDLSTVLANFGRTATSTPPLNPAADLNEDGVVNTLDMIILVGHFGGVCL